MKLSVIVPGIRPQNWQKLYDSVDYSQGWEMLFIGPYPPPYNARFKTQRNFEWIKSFRSPNAAQQEGLLNAESKYVTFCADDGVFLPGALDKAISMAEERTIVVGKYLEGDSPHPDMLKEAYYKFGYHKAYRLKGVPQDALIFNCGIISREFLLELGGYDAEYFDCTTIGHADLSIRAYNAGAKMILMGEPLFKCSHQPGNSGDHAPINRAMRKDLFELEQIYSLPGKRIIIPLDNFEKTPERWRERFGK